MFQENKINSIVIY